MRDESEVRLMMAHMRRLPTQSPKGDGFGQMNASTFRGMGMMLDGFAWACGEPNVHLDCILRVERGEPGAREEFVRDMERLRDANVRAEVLRQEVDRVQELMREKVFGKDGTN